MLSSGRDASRTAAGIGTEHAPAQQHGESRPVDTAAVALQHEHVQRQRRHEQRPRHESQIEIDQKWNRNRAEAEADRSLQDRRDGHDGRHDRNGDHAHVITATAKPRARPSCGSHDLQ